MKKIKKIEKIQFFKGKVRITKRKVPFWAKPFQRFGLFLKVGRIISDNKYSNVFCNVGKHTVLDRLAGTLTKTGELTYLALGSNTATPAATNTQLGTEVYRHLISEKNRTGLVVYTSTFIPTDEGNGTHKEMGLFGDDASGTINSGTLYSHLSIDEIKNDGESVTVDYDIEAL